MGLTFLDVGYDPLVGGLVSMLLYRLIPQGPSGLANHASGGGVG